jgi:hypothetical protein
MQKLYAPRPARGKPQSSCREEGSGSLAIIRKFQAGQQQKLELSVRRLAPSTTWIAPGCLPGNYVEVNIPATNDFIDAAQAVKAAKKTTLLVRPARIIQVVIELSLHLMCSIVPLRMD